MYRPNTLDALSDLCADDYGAKEALRDLRWACVDYAEKACEIRLVLIALHHGVVSRSEVELAAQDHGYALNVLTEATDGLTGVLSGRGLDTSWWSQLSASPD